VGAVTFLVGGVRSGKSTLAVEMGTRHDGEVVFVATAEPFDDDLRDRVDRHRLDRPAWPTVEAPMFPAREIVHVDPDALVIVDCLTVWVANQLHRELREDAICTNACELAHVLHERRGPAVVVSNETGLGVHAPTELGRRFADLLGHVNQLVARTADRTLLLVAGRAVQLADPWELLR
jgi:adenosyl cobinamide kinase/adenosyl cobinamide phosphate guanylyltransferase